MLSLFFGGSNAYVFWTNSRIILRLISKNFISDVYRVIVNNSTIFVLNILQFYYTIYAICNFLFIINHKTIIKYESTKR